MNAQRQRCAAPEGQAMTLSDQEGPLAKVPADGVSIGNLKLRELLGWEESRYTAARDALVVAGTLLKSQGRGGTVRRAQGAHGSTASPKTEKPTAKTAAQAKAAPEPAKSLEPNQPAAKDQNFSSFIWSVADLLRGDYRQSYYGKVNLPFTVLRRLDCVLKASKFAGGN